MNTLPDPDRIYIYDRARRRYQWSPFGYKLWQTHFRSVETHYRDLWDAYNAAVRLTDLELRSKP